MSQANPGDVARAAYEAEQRLAKLNAERKEAKADKDRYRAQLDAIMEDLGLSHVGAPSEDGKGSMYYYVNKAHFDIVDSEKVREWAEQEDEAYIDPEPTLRESLIFQECRRRDEEGLPLPPGVVKRSEKELHKRAL